MTMLGDRCEWSDLPRSTCGHCTRAPQPQLPPEVRAEEPPPAEWIWKPVVDRLRREQRDWHDGDKAPKKASACRYVEGWGYYLREHLPICRDRDCEGCKPCTHDDHGNPVRHCKAREGCGEHLDYAHPITCPRCIARVRADLAHIERLSALMITEAEVDGIDSTAAYLAAPVTDPAHVAELRFYVEGHATHAYRTGRIDGAMFMRILTALPDDDDRHPLTLLWRWERMLAEDYGHERKGPVTVSSAVSYLSWLLTDMAQDPEQDFPLFASEVRQCRSYLETVLGASRAPERGAPCWKCPEHRETCEDPECQGCRPRLERRRAHWCEKPGCTREHDATGARDTWVCPTNREHWWTEAEYRKATYEDAVAEGMKPRRSRSA